MSAHPPPVPPANRSSKGPGESGKADPANEHAPGKAPENLAEQDRQGAIKQNTTHPGLQQDR